MEKILLFIKHRIPIIWEIISRSNSIVFKLVYGKKLKKVINSILTDFRHKDYSYRLLNKSDLPVLETFFKRQPKNYLKYFNPHKLDKQALNRQLKNPAFIMFGVFDSKSSLVGYFFIRFFFNKKCFVGRIVDNTQQGKGLAAKMNDLMYPIAWNMSFRCLSTISKKNTLVQKAHSTNPHIKIIKDLPDQYMLVEFINVN